MATESTTATLEAPAPVSSAFMDAFAKASVTPEQSVNETPAPAKVEKAPEPAKQELVKETEPQKSGRDMFREKPEAKTEAAPVVESELDKIAEPAFKDAKSKAGWDSLKTTAKQAHAERDAIKAESERLKAQLAEYEPLKGKLSEYEKREKENAEVLARARLEDRPEYQRDLAEPRAKAIDAVSKIADESGADASAVVRALASTGKAQRDALAEITAGMDDYSRAEFADGIKAIKAIDERIEAKRKDASKSLEEYREQERLRALQETEKTVEQRKLYFNDAARTLGEKLEVLKEVPGDDKWNARAKAILAEAKHYTDANPHADPEAEIRSAAMVAYREEVFATQKQLTATEQRVKELEAELEGIRSKAPSINRGSNGERGGNLTFMQRVEAAANGREV